MDAVLLVHGTFAFKTRDVELVSPNGREPNAGEEMPWWSPASGFCKDLNSQLEEKAACWPADVVSLLPWHKSRPGVDEQYYDRTAFTWSGLNREDERRLAGERLLEGLLQLEQATPPRPYHLIGHSYGGAAIWYALLEAQRRGQPLANLCSWATMATPFPEYRPKPPLSYLARSVTMAGLLAVCGFVVYQGWEMPFSATGEFLRSVSVTTWVFICFLFIGSLLFTLDAVAALAYGRRCRHERRIAAAAWERFRPRWLGLCSRDDEAVSGLRSAIGSFIPIPKVPVIPLWFVPKCIMLPLWWGLNWLVFPMFESILNYRLRVYFQGSPDLGAALSAIRTEPVPGADQSALLSDALEADLRNAPKHGSHAVTTIDLQRALRQLSEAGRPGSIFFRVLFGNLQTEFGLYHTSYYEVVSIRRALASHVRRYAGKPIGPPQTGAAVTERPCKGVTRSAIGGDRPMDGTPLWNRLLYFLTATLLAVLGYAGITGDYAERFVPRFVDKVDHSSDDAKVVGPMLIPELMKRLKSPNTTPDQRREILTFLANLQARAAPAVPDLTDLLDGMIAGQRLSAAEEDRLIEALGAIGPAASPALESLRKIARGQAPALAPLSDWAKEAIQNIETPADTNSP